MRSHPTPQTHAHHAHTLEEHEADVAALGVERAVVVAQDDPPPKRPGVLGVVDLRGWSAGAFVYI